MDCLTQTCGLAASGSSPQLFIQLIQTLLMSQCGLGGTEEYPRDRTSEILETLGESFDFIIVGGGSAGSVLAARLSEKPDWKVLLIEVGTYPSVMSDVPGMVLALQGSEEDYAYQVEPQSNFCLGMIDKRCKWTKGKVLGGSSAINAMLYVHGNNRDYDSWAIESQGWEYEAILPYLKKSVNYPREDIQKFGDKYFGNDGPIDVRRFNYTDSTFQDVYLKAVSEKGLPVLDAFNMDRFVGFGKAHGTVENGRRQNVARAFLSPAKDRKNLFVMTSARVDQILIEGNRASGVKVTLKDGKTVDLRTRKEIVLSAGSIASPQLLMLSGIGPKDDLEALGIKCKADLPVGKNLQDHLAWLGLQLEFPNGLGQTQTKPPFNVLDEAYKYLIHRKGEFSNVGGVDLLGFVNVGDPESAYPDLQFHHVYVPKGYVFKVDAMLAAFSVDESLTEGLKKASLDSDIVYVIPTLLNSKSVGELTLRSKSPGDQVKIFANYLTDEEDTKTMLKAVEFIKSLLDADTFKRLGVKLRNFGIPGCKDFKFDSPEYWECNIRHTAGTLYHPVGTVRMGSPVNPKSVVDSTLKVLGIEGLRVADASIMPVITSGNPHAATLMIAEKGADLIKHQWGFKDEL
ncbi:hypothetical protein G9C98_006845 [Cotesia typhae]|uniref:Glucose-methanol-choline oxidoreductase N-terminal domain-containing protein n=1 Tax=Cotesia typhae TaxID=2053667 RepID=A0A8J5R229_9HYME|nr:hypothetical protein G9C98_006845 [Cotesia typhae]